MTTRPGNDNDPNMNAAAPARDEGSSQPPHPRRRLRFILLGGAAIAGAALLWQGGQAFAGPGFGHWGHHGGMSDEDMERFMGKRLDRVLDHLDATDDQRVKIKAVIARAKPELKAMRAEKERVHRELEAALVGPTVDPNRLEQARRSALQQLEKGSQLVTRSLAEVAQILTPEQRKKVAAHVARMRR